MIKINLMRRRPQFNKLSDKEYEIFLETYATHLQSMSDQQRDRYKLDNIVRVDRNVIENCLNVYYRNGDWWHYTANRTWY